MRPVRPDKSSSHQADPRAQVDGSAKHRASKDTRRWCLGRVGREHVARFEPTDAPFFVTQPRGYPFQLPLRCAACRKVLRSKVHAWREAFLWETAAGRLQDFNDGAPGTKRIAFLGPGLPAHSFR